MGSLKNADRVKQKTTTTGTVDYVFSASVAGYYDFSDATNGIGPGNECIYAVTMGSNEEVVRGKVAADGLSISRDEVISSSNGGGLVNWAAGEKDIYVTLSAKKSYLSNLNGGQLAGRRNRLTNGGFRCKNVGNATSADGCMAIDGWYVLTQSNPVAVTQLTDPETGSPYGVRITQSNATAQRMALAQIIRAQNCRDLCLKDVIMSGRARLSTSDNIRYAVLEWTGAANPMVLDIINNWTSTTYTGGNFFTSTTLNVLAVGRVAATGATWRDLDGMTATLGASASNLIVLVWTENAVAQNVTLDLGRMQLEPGRMATPFEFRDEKLLPPLIVPVSGQSDTTVQPAYTWKAPENFVGVWNNTLDSTAVGTAFLPPDTTKIGFGLSAAAEAARKNEDRHVVLIIVGYSGQPISKWLTGGPTPDMYAALKANVEAALAVLGLSELDATDPFYWWQGAADYASTTYVADFAAYHARLRAETWWPTTKPIVMMGESVWAFPGFNVSLNACVAAEPDCRRYVHTSAIPQSYWDASSSYWHMLAPGYWRAGQMAVMAGYGVANRGALQGVAVDPATGSIAVGGNVAGANEVLRLGSSTTNAASDIRLQNTNSGNASAARIYCTSDAGDLLFGMFSTANAFLPAQGLLIAYGSGGMYVGAGHASGALFFNAGNSSRWKIEAAGNLIPVADNAYTVGKSGARASVIWAATGTINTSDGRQKTNVTTLDGELAWTFLSRLRPVTYQWISGGTIVTIEDDPDNMVEEEITETVDVPDFEITVEDGKAIARQVMRSEKRKVVDMFPVVDERGEPVLKDGAPLFHQVPRTRLVPAKREIHTSRAGQRVHLGHIAQEVKAAMDDLGVDWGLYIHDTDTDEIGLRPDQFIPIIIAAMQWKFAQVENQNGVAKKR